MSILINILCDQMCCFILSKKDLTINFTVNIRFLFEFRNNIGTDLEYKSSVKLSRKNSACIFFFNYRKLTPPLHSLAQNRSRCVRIEINLIRLSLYCNKRTYCCKLHRRGAILILASYFQRI